MILRVAVAAPLAELFDYLPPAASPRRVLVPGLRLLVPFGRGRRVGMLLRIASRTEQDPARLKRVEAVLDARPLLSPADLNLIEWAAAYYQQPIGEALFTALPTRLRDPAPMIDERQPGIRATPEGRTVDLETLTRAPGSGTCSPWCARFRRVCRWPTSGRVWETAPPPSAHCARRDWWKAVDWRRA